MIYGVVTVERANEGQVLSTPPWLGSSVARALLLCRGRRFKSSPSRQFLSPGSSVSRASRIMTLKVDGANPSQGANFSPARGIALWRWAVRSREEAMAGPIFPPSGRCVVVAHRV